MWHLLISYYTNLFLARRENTFKIRVYLSNIKRKNQGVFAEKSKKVSQKGQNFQNYFAIIGLF